MPDREAEQRVKLNILGMLHEAYGITERDFTRAEIEVVPAHKARDIGLDRAMIGAYGHDDRVDAYPALMAEIGVQNPAYTTVCVLTDKEETGSDRCDRALNSMYTFHFLQQLCQTQGADYIMSCKASKCLSADVTAPMIRPSPMPLSRTTAPTRATASRSTNTPARVENPAQAMRRQNWSAT